MGRWKLKKEITQLKKELEQQKKECQVMNNILESYSYKCCGCHLMLVCKYFDDTRKICPVHIDVSVHEDEVDI